MDIVKALKTAEDGVIAVSVDQERKIVLTIATPTGVWTKRYDIDEARQLAEELARQANEVDSSDD